MLTRFALILSLLWMCACSQARQSADALPPPASVQTTVTTTFAEDKPLNFDQAALFTSQSVKVFSLAQPPQNPFTQKMLQPVSYKVIGDGYPVLDPSVIVFPLSAPRTMPTILFEDIATTDAQSLLLNARTRVGPAPLPLKPKEVVAESLPAIEEVTATQEINAPFSALTASPLPIFSPKGTKFPPSQEVEY